MHLRTVVFACGVLHVRICTMAEMLGRAASGKEGKWVARCWGHAAVAARNAMPGGNVWCMRYARYRCRAALCVMCASRAMCVVRPFVIASSSCVLRGVCIARVLRYVCVVRYV